MEQSDQFQQPQPIQPNLDPQNVGQTSIPQSTEGRIPTISPSPNTEQKPSRKKLFIFIFIVILIGLATLAYFFISQKQIPLTKEDTLAPIPPTTTKTQHYIGSQTITLADVSGGSASGTVSRNITLGKSTHSIIANLPTPPEAQFYQVWQVKGEEHFKFDKLVMQSEGVYVLEKDFQFDPASPPFTTFDTIHNMIVISQENVDDLTIETIILQGTFTQ